MTHDSLLITHYSLLITHYSLRCGEKFGITACFQSLSSTLSRKAGGSSGTLTSIYGWFGAELSYRHKIGVVGAGIAVPNHMRYIL
jgi:hypothetical protein